MENVISYLEDLISMAEANSKNSTYSQELRTYWLGKLHGFETALMLIKRYNS
jgi:hypothetical protein